MAVNRHEQELEEIMQDPVRRAELDEAKRRLGDPRIQQLLYDGFSRLYEEDPTGMTPEEFRARLDLFNEPCP